MAQKDMAPAHSKCIKRLPKKLCKKEIPLRKTQENTHTLTKKGRLVNAAWYEIVNHISLYTPFVTGNMGNAPSNL